MNALYVAYALLALVPLAWMDWKTHRAKILLGGALFAVIALVIGIPLGTIAGVKPRSLWDWGLSLFTVGTLGVPSFLLGVLLLWLFAVTLGWLPASGRVSPLNDPVDSMRHLAFPAIALGTGLALLWQHRPGRPAPPA